VCLVKLDPENSNLRPNMPAGEQRLMTLQLSKYKIHAQYNSSAKFMRVLLDRPRRLYSARLRRVMMGSNSASKDVCAKRMESLFLVCFALMKASNPEYAVSSTGMSCALGELLLLANRGSILVDSSDLVM